MSVKDELTAQLSSAMLPPLTIRPGKETRMFVRTLLHAWPSIGLLMLASPNVTLRESDGTLIVKSGTAWHNALDTMTLGTQWRREMRGFGFCRLCWSALLGSLMIVGMVGVLIAGIWFACWYLGCLMTSERERLAALSSFIHIATIVGQWILGFIGLVVGYAFLKIGFNACMEARLPQRLQTLKDRLCPPCGIAE